MKIQYRLRNLPRFEQELIAMVMFEEIELQKWFAVTCSTLMGQEVLLTLQ